MVSTIQLSRQFFEWSEAEDSDPEVHSWRAWTASPLTWDQLLVRRRVVVLAEAGSGKTEEMQAQARGLTQAGRFAFYATVEDVGRDGLEQAVSPADRVRLAAWRDTDQLAWFFIDSVDEAKLNRVRFQTALRRIAEGIQTAARRAHVILSSRHTDWEFQRDLRRLNEELPVPSEVIVPPAPDPNTLLISTIRYERVQKSSSPVETALVVAMKPLDPERVRLFATAKDVTDVDVLIAQIEAGNLWSFARRPLDLDWLVQFWRTHRRLGSLMEMLETSLSERLREPNLARTRSDALNVTHSFHALERIGAALIFRRTSTIHIPDSELTISRENPPLDLAKVLPDFSESARTSLMTRPVFDLATFGRVRLHNDNQGAVRAYLAARWLHRLRRGELSQSQLFDLLFADSYGIKLVKPSMRETVAWLAIWDEAVATELAAREPWVLLTAGDPGSLTETFRQSVLSRLVRQIAATDQTLPLLDRDSLKRFSKPDLTSTIRQCWAAHKDHPEVRDLLLRLIALGELKDCADLAAELAFTVGQSRHDLLFAGRAVMSAGDAGMRQRYAEFVKAGCPVLPDAVMWEAIKGLFPAYLKVRDLLGILTAIDLTNRDGTRSLEWDGPVLVSKTDAADVESLLSGLLAQLGAAGGLGDPPTEREESYFPMVAAAAYRLVEQSGEYEAPMLAVDAVLRLGENFRTLRPSSRRSIDDVAAELRRTPARRRLAFWRAAAHFTGHVMLRGSAVTSPWQMEILGWAPGLVGEDLDWLLADAPTRTGENERQLAINGALQVWHQTGSSPAVLARIEAVARNDEATMQAYLASTQPRIKSAEEVESERELKKVQRRGAIERAKIDRSWVKFVENLKANPEQLWQLRPTTPRGADARLFSLWQLLSAAQHNSNRYGIESVKALEPILGRELAAAVQDGLSHHWRAWLPTLKSARQPDKRNQIATLDCMGIAGIALEANSRPGWAERLTFGEARLAASYATLEINGFPNWLSVLASAKPQEVSEVLIGEILAELQDSDPERRCETLNDASRSAPAVRELLASLLLQELEQRTDLCPTALDPMLGVLASGLRTESDRFKQIAITRFQAAPDPNIASLYLGAVFRLDSAAATDALLAKLDSLDIHEQTALAQCVLPQIFVHHFLEGKALASPLPFETLERLVALAFRTIRMEDDRRHQSGVMYSPDGRDLAERARSDAFNQFVQTPGRATYDALLRLAEDATFPIPPSRLHALARDRAAGDSESAPWPPDELLPFEQTCQTAPTTARDLQLAALLRLADMQHDLLHADFQQGATLRLLPDETAVQNWVADRLRLKQGRSYGVEREPHVVGEKKPDVRLRAKATDASVPIEIKVPEDCSLEELENALSKQLCAQYLRARDAQYGILLLVHQKLRARGWLHAETGAFLAFEEVVTHLCAIAARISGSASHAPQPAIAVFDVSQQVPSDQPLAAATARLRGESRRANNGARRAGFGTGAARGQAGE